jgi:hypothetical protein
MSNFVESLYRLINNKTTFYFIGNIFTITFKHFNFFNIDLNEWCFVCVNKNNSNYFFINPFTFTSLHQIEQQLLLRVSQNHIIVIKDVTLIKYFHTVLLNLNTNNNVDYSTLRNSVIQKFKYNELVGTLTFKKPLSTKSTFKIHTFLSNIINKNEYRFNPSILRLPNLNSNIYFCVYRFIKYDTDNDLYPWTAWWDGYKYFKDKYPSIHNRLDMIELSACKIDKPIIKINLNDEQENYKWCMNVPEYDSTGIAFLKYNVTTKEFDVIYYNDLVFLNTPYLQDARLMMIDDKVKMTFNRIKVIDHQVLVIEMFMKDVDFSGENAFITFSNEEKLLTTPNRIEKNITLFTSEDMTLYSINGDFIWYDRKQNLFLNKGPVSKIQATKSKYECSGDLNTVYFSLSTPAVTIKPFQYYLLAGHCKMSFHIFNKYIDTTQIKHKNIGYVYFIYFIQFNLNGEVLEISPLFIPTSEKHHHHLPFLLSFPCGLCVNEREETILISYGEGDSRCKILQMGFNDLQYLFDYDRKRETLSVGFYCDGIFRPIFDETSFTNNLKINKINILGYYHHLNTGDDGFMIVLKQLFKPYHVEIEFFNPDNSITQCDYLFVGGGNVVNPYFFNTLKYFREYHPQTPIIGFGVEIPYPVAQAHLVNILDYCFVRNENDLQFVVINNKGYIPDLLFALQLNKDECILGDDDVFQDSNFKIGVCLAQPYINEESYPTEAKLFIDDVVDLLNKINNLKKNVSFYLIPFGINKTKNDENDYIISQRILQKCESLNIKIVEIDEKNNVFFVMNYISKMDFCICSRYHAHVFSIISNKPFISLTSQKKCLNVLKEFDISHWNIPLNINEYDIPYGFDVDKAVSLFTYINTNLHFLESHHLEEKVSEKQTQILQVFSQLIEDLFYRKCSSN